MGIEGGDQATDGREYRTGAGGYATALRPLFVAGIIVAITGHTGGWWTLGERSTEQSFQPTTVFYVFMGALVLALVVWAVTFVMREVNARVRVSHGGVTVNDWRNSERFVAWESIVGLRWEHTRGKKARGSLAVEVLDEYGNPRSDRIAYYNGALPKEILELRGAIIARARLSQAEERDPDWWSRTEDVVWRRL